MKRSEKMLNRLEERVKEALVRAEERFPHLEVRSFDYSVLKEAVSLVEDIVRLISRFRLKEKYRFLYYLTFPINDKFLVIAIRLSITRKKFTHTLGILYATSSPRLKPSEKEKGALFVTFYYLNTDYQMLELQDDLQRLAAKRNLHFHKGFEVGVGYGNPFPSEAYYSFEIPFDVEVVEYII